MQQLQITVAAQPAHPADAPAVASEIGRFLRFGIITSPTVGGVGEGRKAAAKPWPFGGAGHGGSDYEHSTGSPDGP